MNKIVMCFIQPHLLSHRSINQTKSRFCSHFPVQTCLNAIEWISLRRSNEFVKQPTKMYSHGHSRKKQNKSTSKLKCQRTLSSEWKYIRTCSIMSPNYKFLLWIIVVGCCFFSHCRRCHRPSSPPPPLSVSLAFLWPFHFKLKSGIV